MNEMYFRIAGVQRKIDANRKLRANVKKLGILILFVVLFFTWIEPETMRTTWVLSVVFIILLFFFEVYYIKQGKKYEFELYRLEVDEQERKRELSDLTGQPLPNHVLNRKITMPSDEISLPILYYLIILIVDVLIRIFMLH